MRLLTALPTILLVNATIIVHSSIVSNRAKLVDLLNTLDYAASESANRDFVTLIESGSFLERTVSGGGGGGGAPPENRRRVNAHEPCECPDLSDTEADPCLSKRLGMVRQAISAISGDVTQSSATLRSTYGASITQLQDIENRITNAYGIINKGMDGNATFQATISQQVLAIRALADSLATCLNNYWGQSFIVYEIARRDTEGLDDTIRDSFRQLVLYLSQVQKSQDAINYSNGVLTTQLLNAALANKTSQVNSLSQSVYTILGQLSDNMDLNEDGTSKLATSLQAAADSLNVSISQFPTAVSTYLDQTKQDLAAASVKSTTSFSASVQQLLAQLTAKATQKLQQLTNATSASVTSDRSDFVTNVYGSVDASTKADLATTLAERTSFLNYSQATIYTNAQAAIDALVANNTNAIQAFLAKDKPEMSQITVNVSSINTAFSGLGPASSKQKAALQILVNQRTSAANDAVDQVLSPLALTAHNTLASAAAVSEQALDGVNTDTQNNQNAMLGQMTTNSDAFSQADSDTAQASSQAMGQGQTLVTTALSSLDSASSNLDGTLSDQFTGNLNQITGLPIVSSGVSLNAILNGTTIAQSQDTVTTGQAQIDAATSGVLTNGHASVQTLLQNMLAHSANGTLSMHQIEALLQHQMRLHRSQADAKGQIDGDARRATAAGADAVASSQDTLSSRLQALANSVGPALTQAANNQFGQADVSDAISQLADTKTNLDAAYNVAPTDMGPAQLSIQSSSSKVFDIGSSRSADMGDSVAQAQQLIALSTDPRQAAQLIQSQIVDTNRVGTRFESNLDRETTNQLEGFRSAAGSSNDLVSKMLAFLKSDGVDLESAKATLPVTGNKMSSVSDSASLLGLSQSFGSARDFWKAASELVASNLTLAEQTTLAAIADVWSAFNSSMTQLPISTQSTIANALSQFGNADTTLATAVNGSVAAANASATSIESNATGQAILSTSELQDVQAQISALMNQNGTIMSNVSTQNSTDGTTSLLNAAMAAAGTAQSMGSTVGGMANDAGNEAQGVIQGAIQSLNMSLSHAGALNGLQASVQMSAMDKQAALNQQVSQDTTATVGDYEEQMREQTALAESQPDLVYAQVVKNKADVDSAMGRLMSTAVSLNSDALANATAPTAISAAMTKFYVATIQKVFNIYAGVDNTSAKLADVQASIDTAIQSILGAEVVRKRDKLDATLNDTRDQVIQQVLELRDSLIAESDKHSAMDSIDTQMRSDISSWQQGILNDTNAVETQLATSNLTTMQGGMDTMGDLINGTVGSLIDTIEASFKGSSGLDASHLQQLEAIRARFSTTG